MGIFDSMLNLNIDQMKTKRDIDGLTKALNNKRSVYARRDPAKALGEIGDPVSMEHLVTSLKDSNNLVREAAAEAIGKMGGDPRAVQTMVEPLKNGNSIAREEAASAFG